MEDIDCIDDLKAQLHDDLACRVEAGDGPVTNVDDRWAGVLNQLHEELVDVWPDYRLAVSGGFEALRISCDFDDQLACCAAATAAAFDAYFDGGSWEDTPHDDSAEHHAAVVDLQERSKLARRLLERAQMRLFRIEETYVPGDRRVVVALDIDGVLNALGERDGLERHDLRVKSGLVKSPFFVGNGRGDVKVKTKIDPDVIAWVNGLVSDDVEIVWATTWEVAARMVFAPAVGLEDFKVGIDTNTYPPRFGHVRERNSVGWKADALAKAFPGRPLVWVDDMAGRYQDAVWRHPDDDEQTLVVACNPDEGVSVADRAAVEEFIARFASIGDLQADSQVAAG